jgi:hypothetical protein
MHRDLLETSNKIVSACWTTVILHYPLHSFRLGGGQPRQRNFWSYCVIDT